MCGVASANGGGPKLFPNCTSGRATKRAAPKSARRGVSHGRRLAQRRLAPAARDRTASAGGGRHPPVPRGPAARAPRRQAAQMGNGPRAGSHRGARRWQAKGRCAAAAIGRRPPADAAHRRVWFSSMVEGPRHGHVCWGWRVADAPPPRPARAAGAADDDTRMVGGTHSSRAGPGNREKSAWRAGLSHAPGLQGPRTSHTNAGQQGEADWRAPQGRGCGRAGARRLAAHADSF